MVAARLAGECDSRGGKLQVTDRSEAIILARDAGLGRGDPAT